jgi:hypothetical protein
MAGAALGSAEFSEPGPAVRGLALTLLLCGAASLLNPAGFALWGHTTGYLGIDFLVDATQGYQSVDFHEGYGKIFFVALFAGPALWMTGRVRVTRLAAGLYLLFAAASLHSARNIPLFTVVSLPWLAVWAQQALRGGGPRETGALRRMLELERVDRHLRPGLASVAALGLAWWAAGPGAAAYRWDPGEVPVEALRTMGAASPPGNVFNQMAWGGFLLYERDDVPVFIDGQTDFYGPRVSAEYLTVLKGRPGWAEVLDRYDVRWTFTQKGEPINQLLALDPDWELIAADDVAVAYRRTDP